MNAALRSLAMVAGLLVVLAIFDNGYKSPLWWVVFAGVLLALAILGDIKRKQVRAAKEKKDLFAPMTGRS